MIQLKHCRWDLRLALEGTLLSAAALVACAGTDDAEGGANPQPPPAHAVLGKALGVAADGRETFASIVCHDRGSGVHEVQATAWGVAYPANTELHVIQQITVDDTFWRTNERWPRTTGSGSWTTPTGTYDASLMSGTFLLSVYVARNSDGELLDIVSDSCSL